MDSVWFLPWWQLWLPLLALGLDLWLGDPRSLPHPVNLIGRLLSWLQKPLLALEKKQASGCWYERLGGGLALLCALLVTGLFAALALNVFHWFFCLWSSCPRFSWAWICSGLVALYLSWSGLALGCLLREGEKARQALLRLDTVAENEAQAALAEARHAVGMLVSRDVSKLDAVALYRTLSESLSENFNDAFVAPFFWLLVGGPVGLWVYKCSSTADSRWGYKHAPWTHIGWAAARLDDVLAYIPARISAALLFLSRSKATHFSGDVKRTSWPGWVVVKLDAAKMESPNAGWSMAAAAWLHRAGMGGPAVYAGQIKMKPWLGPENSANWDARRIENLLQHLRRAGIWGGLLLTGLLAMLRFTLEII